ncbi:MAG: FtsW/RodA/SpoVE family cell cycle protein [Chthoniobacterales bacterium]
MTPFLKKLLKLNWILLILMIALSIFGVFAIYSATWMMPGKIFWKLQAAYFGIALIIFFVTAMVDYRWVRWGALPIYLISVVCLVATLVLGRKVYGAKSWIQIGPINFQPSMVAVIACILVVALFLSEFRKMHPFLRIILCGAIVGAPMLLVLIQPDLGAVIVYLPILLGMWFIANIPLRYLVAILLLVIAMIPLVTYFGLKEYQRARITTFLNPNVDPLGDAWTINRSMDAIGSGGWSGKGFKSADSLNELGLLPSTIVHNDFIFSVIGEQHGFVGGCVLLGSFAVLLLTGLYIIYHAADELGKLIGVGVVMLIFTHIFMNTGMTISLTPITGLPLPLISYGGSFVLVVVFGLGLLQSIWIHRRQLR